MAKKKKRIIKMMKVFDFLSQRLSLALSNLRAILFRKHHFSPYKNNYWTEKPPMLKGEITYYYYKVSLSGKWGFRVNFSFFSHFIYLFVHACFSIKWAFKVFHSTVRVNLGNGVRFVIPTLVGWNRKMPGALWPACLAYIASTRFNPETHAPF